MPQKGPVRQEYIDAFKEGRLDEIPAEHRQLVEDVVNRQSDREISAAEHEDLPPLPPEHQSEDE